MGQAKPGHTNLELRDQVRQEVSGQGTKIG